MNSQKPAETPLMSTIEIAVIGGGPAGLSAAVNAVVRGRAVRLLSGGEPAVSRAERIDNVLGLPDLDGRALMNTYNTHAAAMGIHIDKARVANLMPLNGRFLLNIGLADGGVEMLDAGAVVLATGAARGKPVTGETELLGRGVSYCATCDGMLYRGRRAVVWGLSEEAVHEANYLSGIGVAVTYVSFGTRPAGLQGGDFIAGRLTGVAGETRVTGAILEDKTIECDVLFILRDAIAPDTLIPGLALDNGYIRVDRMMRTNVPGLFAAGDCTGPPLQIDKAVGEGLVAGQQAAKYFSSHAAGE